MKTRLMSSFCAVCASSGFELYPAYEQPLFRYPMRQRGPLCKLTSFRAQRGVHRDESLTPRAVRGLKKTFPLTSLMLIQVPSQAGKSLSGSPGEKRNVGFS